MPDRSPTPDIERVPFGFSSERRSRVRILSGYALLGFASLRGAAKVQRFLSPRVSSSTESLWARCVIRALRIRLDISGVEHIEPNTQYLVMPLHEGFMDVPTLLHLPLDLRFTVRQELFSEPALSSYLRATRQISVPENPSVRDLRAMYHQVSEAIDDGASVVVFPQGSILGIEVAFQQGAARLARHFGLPILPVAIAGTHRVWEFPYSQTARLDQEVTMTVFKPIDSADLTEARFRAIEQEVKTSALNSSPRERRFVPERDGWWDEYVFEIDTDFPELLARVEARRSSSAHQ